MDGLREELKDLTDHLRPFTLEEWTLARWYFRVLYVAEVETVVKFSKFEF